MSQSVKWITLPDAAQRMYDELQGTRWRTEADGEATPEARLDYLATYLVRNTPVEGRHPPSSTHKPIPRADFNAGVIKGGGRYFQRHYESFLTFVDMRVNEEDLRDTIESMKAG